MGSTSEPAEPRLRRPYRAALWALASLAAVLAAAVALVALLQNRERPLVLLALVFGLACGWAAGELAGRLALAEWRRRLVPAAFAILLAGQLAIALESHRRYAGHVRAAFAGDPAAIVASQMRARGHLHPKAYAAFAAGAEERRQLVAERSSFRGYLQSRVSGRQALRRPPWPLVLWLSEALIGSAAGTWFFARVLRSVARPASVPLS